MISRSTHTVKELGDYLRGSSKGEIAPLKGEIARMEDCPNAIVPTLMLEHLEHQLNLDDDKPLERW